MQTPAGVWKRAAGNPFKVPPLKDRLAYPADLRHNGDRMPMVQDWYDASRARHLAPPQGLPQPRAGAIYPCFSLSALPPCHCAFPQSGPWQASNRHPLFFGGPAGRRQFSGAHPAGWLSGLSARVVKLVDAGDSKSPAARRVGSSPTPGTSLRKAAFRSVWGRPLVYLAGSAGRSFRAGAKIRPFCWPVPCPRANGPGLLPSPPCHGLLRRGASPDTVRPTMRFPQNV